MMRQECATWLFIRRCELFVRMCFARLDNYLMTASRA